MEKKADRVKQADKPPVPRPLKLNGEEAERLAIQIGLCAHDLERSEYISMAIRLGKLIELVRSAREVGRGK